MKNLKKAKKIINVNYCFENGDELEIPFVYKPAVMNHIKLTFDFIFSANGITLFFKASPK